MATMFVVLLAAALVSIAITTLAAKPQPVRIRRSATRDELLAEYLSQRDR